MTLIVACGLKREARIFDRVGRDVFVVVGGGMAAKLMRDLDDKAGIVPAIILSAGVAGALDPKLRAGDVVIDGDTAIVALLALALPQAIAGKVIGSDGIVATAVAKRTLAEETGAIAVDMESHVAAAIARRRDLPFGVIRAISDQAGDSLPPAALVGMRPDGGMALGRVLAALAHRPGQLPALIATGRNAGRAFRSLTAAFDRLYAAGLDRVALAELPAD